MPGPSDSRSPESEETKVKSILDSVLRVGPASAREARRLLVNRELVSWQRELPTIQADPISLGSVVEQLIADEGLRRDKGAEARRFVERVHSSRVVAEQLIDLYRAL
jgi:glycosyltransferase involved in cell wall biosynthesis